MLRGGLLIGLAGVGAGAVQAETSPYYLGASQRFTRNSNVFLERDASARSDTISSTGIRLGFDQPISRQRLSASLSANANRYGSLDQLNNTDYALDARLDWETVEHLSGNLVLGSRESLSPDATALSQNVRNLFRVDSVGFQAQLGGVTRWSFDTGAAYTRTRYSDAFYERNNSTQQAVNAGVRVTPASGLTLRACLRHANIDYPKANNEVSRNDFDLSAFVNPGGASVFNARFSLTRESHTLVDRNLRSWTGQLGWQWKPTGKLSTNLSLTRDTSNGAYDFTSGVFNVGSSENRLATTLALTANWEVTSKIAVVGNLSHQRRTLDNALTIGSSGGSGVLPSSAKDRINSIGLNVQYAVTRHVDLGCGVSWSDRSVASQSGSSTLTWDYDVTTYSCFGQIMLR